jgi:hypothetical protein
VSQKRKHYDEEFVDIETAKHSGRTNFTKMVKRFQGFSLGAKDPLTYCHTFS